MKGKKWIPHITAAATLVVFIALASACSSAPKPPKVPRSAMKVTQPEMALNDPRMLLDAISTSRFYLSDYWLGSRVPDLPFGERSAFQLQSAVRDLKIDGIPVVGNRSIRNGIIYLAPGVHDLFFNYYAEETMRSGPGGNTKENVTVSFPGATMEIDMKPGRMYSINHSVSLSDNIRDVFDREVLGRSGRYYVGLSLGNSSDSNIDAATRSNASHINERKYFEPYGYSTLAGLPESQCFLDIADGIYVVKFNGEGVSWGWTKDWTATIGITTGRNELQLVRAGKKNNYTVTIDCLPGHRLVLDDNNGRIRATDITIGKNYQVREYSTRASQTMVSIDMVQINGGTFTRGSPASEHNHSFTEAQQQVTVSTFFMGKYEITQKEYQAVMMYNPSHFKGDKLPVENVSWYDAVEFCNALSEREGLTPAYTIDGENVTWNREANGYRLPTEAEWEYACRAGTTTPFSTGNNITTSQANYDGTHPYNNNSKGKNRQKTTAVGSFSSNPWGLYDMHGNVIEWCWDIRSQNYPSNAQTDPVGPSFGNYRVIRGGSWGSDGYLLRSANRSFNEPSSRHNYRGFRVVRP